MVDIHAVVNADETDLSVLRELLEKEFPGHRVYVKEQCKGSFDDISIVSDKDEPCDDAIIAMDKKINELKEKAKKSL
ncbi:hypothetical protein [Pantoea sp. ACRSB]|uniref:hypothetical protein n=1 Tax=Pantoea sp. ACRSB TaxID=2918207 RepID=UPI0028934D95|nr:hypothetical protein [Pantoea sp. ACRSB]MCG7391242.1 hypothetical protein [Pantoea sp. ACRSB]